MIFKLKPRKEEKRIATLQRFINAYLADNIERQSQNKYLCTIDNTFHSSETAAKQHIKLNHKRCFEQLLKFLLSDMEQEHMGLMITKLFCADLLYSQPLNQHTSSSAAARVNDYPSVKAPAFHTYVFILF